MLHTVNTSITISGGTSLQHILLYGPAKTSIINGHTVRGK